jgi:hypothetical protein
MTISIKAVTSVSVHICQAQMHALLTDSDSEPLMVTQYRLIPDVPTTDSAMMALPNTPARRHATLLQLLGLLGAIALGCHC